MPIIILIIIGLMTGFITYLKFDVFSQEEAVDFYNDSIAWYDNPVECYVAIVGGESTNTIKAPTFHDALRKAEKWVENNDEHFDGWVEINSHYTKDWRSRYKDGAVWIGSLNGDGSYFADYKLKSQSKAEGQSDPDGLVFIYPNPVPN